MKRKRSGLPAALAGLLFPAAAVGALLCFAAALDGLSAGRAGEEQRQLEQALRRSCVACYAVEGAYPAGLEDLEARYGLQIDEKRFTVRYRAIAENLMPEITVLENEE